MRSMRWAYFMSCLLLGLWLGATVAVDFFAVPAVFQNVSNLNEAAGVGMSVFARFNTLELILSIVLLILWPLAHRLKFKSKKHATIFIFEFFLLILATSYFFYFTPEITKLSLAKANAFEESERQMLEHSIATLHSLYIKLDSLKLIILLGLNYFIFYDLFAFKQEESL